MNGAFLEFGLWGVGYGVYVAGVLWGLLLSDARPLERAVLALLWPLGPLAFVVTVMLLLIALPVAFPKVGIPLWLTVGALWWLYSVSASV